MNSLGFWLPAIRGGYVAKQKDVNYEIWSSSLEVQTSSDIVGTGSLLGNFDPTQNSHTLKFICVLRDFPVPGHHIL